MASIKPGLTWGTTGDPDDLKVLVSALPNKIDGLVEQLVRELLVEAVAEVKHNIETRPVYQGAAGNTPPGNRGGPGRRLTNEMFNSVTYKLTYTKSGRVQGSFGYLNNPPKWAIMQEYGTEGGQGNGRGILEMLALTDAYTNFKVKLQDALGNGRTLTFNEGQFSG